MANSTWTAPAGCYEHHRVAVERFVNSLPAAWRQDPTVGEVFKDRKEAEARLQLFSLVQGFDVVCRGGGSTRQLGLEMRCIHHSQVTRNYRALEDRVIRDKEGNITSQRRRDGINVHQTNCNWRVRIAWVFIDKKDEVQGKEWRLTKASLTHQGHKLLKNLLAAYPTHKRRIPKFQELLIKTTAYRRA